MASQRPVTPSGGYNGIPPPQDPAHLSRGYGANSHLNVDGNDFANTPSAPVESSPLSQSLNRYDGDRLGRFEENFDARTRGSSVLGDGEHVPARSASRASTVGHGASGTASGTPSRSGTLKKRASVKRSGSLKRSSSRRSVRAGSIKGVEFADEDGSGVKHNSVFYTPVPTSGSPTDILANRFQAWRKLLKDLITYFREVGASYEHRSKALLKVSNVVNNTNAPALFLADGGLNDANKILRDYHKQALSESNKAKEIESEVVNQLSGLRADLSQKIKEIKSLSGDFKNSVDKEKENTRKAVGALEESLALIDSDPAAVAGKGDPFVVRLGVERQVERQIDEENYLHRAYLNLEHSGRELESIVVGEIQKAYNALASIMKHEADENYSTIEKLRSGPVGMSRDLEWNEFVTHDPHFVNPNLPLRRLEDIEYPGKHHPAAAEVRAGMLERKSKYLKSYTPGWYVLSPTHLHEFKSADRIYTQPPVMSLLLSDQKLGSHAQPNSSSYKFVIKGRQTGSMHRGHTWIFRAETYDTMLAWYDDINSLIDKTGDERNAFVTRHKRSMSTGSTRSVSSDGGLEEDEADHVPFSAAQSVQNQGVAESERPSRPSPGGRFPSDLQVDRSLQARGPSSGSSSEVGLDLATAAGGPQMAHASYPNAYDDRTPYDAAYGPGNPYEYHPDNPQQQFQRETSYFANNAPETPGQGAANPPYPNQNASQSAIQPVPYQPYQPSTGAQTPVPQQQPQKQYPTFGQGQPQIQTQRVVSNYGDWMAPAAAGAGGLAAGAVGAEALHRHREAPDQENETNAALAGPTSTSAPQDYASHPASQLVSQHGNAALVGGAVPIPPRSGHGLDDEGHEAFSGVSNPVMVTTEGQTSAVAREAVVGVAAPVVRTAERIPEPESSARDFPQATPGLVAAEEGKHIGSANGEVVGGGSGEVNVVPGVRRQNTDFSVSDLHVPGEYPKQKAV
ncbi:uncharacterized protein CC84DRAFT_1130312 [Paraphaeosphaeria sporulosa]|uniref:PH domain-containing protein n=1 Tax=Paraphaeosphaeria sporulosa TaxID=1460663 RepID=A0A177BXX4_9PLEO|nr:uncharacterized protein CC84DRAFT_1130312 [Paraphaeosphaeria sporulosa]OAF99551.1 hypothetical protein CC84DRAFT_1130312 [Paraphaeosphaeria sporulosa]